MNFFSNPEETLELAKFCDHKESFHRFWVGEHHNADQVADPLALALVAVAKTRRIRIGTGALGLVCRNPFQIAEAAYIGERLYPGRIDIGITKSIPTDKNILSLVAGSDKVGSLQKKYDDQIHILREALAGGGRLKLEAPITQHATRVGPPIFVMGTSTLRAKQVGRLGLALVTSFHHGGTVESIGDMIRTYKKNFIPSPWFRKPLAISVLSGYVSKHKEDRKVFAETAVALIGASRLAGRPQSGFAICHDPKSAVEKLRSLAHQVKADEVMFLCAPLSFESTRKCYVDIAKEWK